MKFAWLACLCFGGLLFAGPEDPALNVNSRYTVEKVELSPEIESRISRSLRPQAVVADTSLSSPVGHVLASLYGRPSFRVGSLLVWRR